jgi:hypothetical protein
MSRKPSLLHLIEVIRNLERNLHRDTDLNSLFDSHMNQNQKILEEIIDT